MHSINNHVALDSLLDSKSASLVVVNFYTEGCDPRQVTASFLSVASKKLEHVTFVQVNLNEAQELTNKWYGVVAVPALVFFKNKTIVERIELEGADQKALQMLLDKHAPFDFYTKFYVDYLDRILGLLVWIWVSALLAVLARLVGVDTTSSAPEKDSFDKPNQREETCSLDEGVLKSIWHPEAFQNIDSTCLPPEHLLNDIHAELVATLSPSTQSRAAHSTSEAPNFEPTLSLYCPLEGGEYIIDATVKELARRTTSQIQVIDIARLAAEQCGHYWIDSFKPTLESTRVSGFSSASAKEKLGHLIKEILQSRPPESNLPDGHTSRLIYVRDFRLLASSAPSFYSTLLAAVQNQLKQRLESGPSTSTAIVLGVSAKLARYAGSRIDSTLTRGNWGHRKHSELPSDWDESSSAQASRESRLKDKYNRWNSRDLLDDIHRTLAKTGVFPGASRRDISGLKHSRSTVVVPEKRNLEHERKAREQRRFDINYFHAQMTLFAAGGELLAGPPTSQENLDDFTQLCRNKIIPFDLFRCLADRALSAATTSSDSRQVANSNQTSSPKSQAAVTWDDLRRAWESQDKLHEERSGWLESSMPPSNDAEPEANATPNKDEGTKNTDEDAKDPDEDDDVVKRVKGEHLGKYEERMLDHVVKPAQIQTGFDSVHLPAETIQTIRSLVSLPLICPEAFQMGILKQYNMTGALLFGPPGTGKTHLARAIAKESGSRMISVKPSDIQDKYVGETEKIIDGLFKLARRLKPCIIFIDEVDSLLGARTDQQACNSARWHTSMLTQFMQEMDGMAVSDVVVIGTTNRPFDLDDAVIRRLPCRILVDLPDRAAREAILRILLKDEHLEEDFDIKTLAVQTERFSGSDLKHLCVMAAYESVKESAHAKMPWNKEQPTAPSQSELSSGTLSESSASNSITTTGQELGTLCPTTGDSHATAPSDTPTCDESQTPEKESTPPESPQVRKLSKQHFLRALTHVRASASDTQASIRELHRWNQQFGSGRR